jgi:hypothetical protein
MNAAFGCPASYNTFKKQLDCAANTMADRYAEVGALPYFFPVTTPINSIRHWVNSGGYQTVGFNLNSRGTLLYKYTPHTTTGAAGGGNYLFEQLWLQFGF